MQSSLKLPHDPLPAAKMPLWNQFHAGTNEAKEQPCDQPSRKKAKSCAFDQAARAALMMATTAHPAWTSPAEAYAWLRRELAIRAPFSAVDAFCRSKGLFPAHFRSLTYTRVDADCDNTLSCEVA